jgi:arylsulfatase
MISYVDYQVGRMLKELERLGCLDNTLIVFTSDHGEYLGDYGCFGKRGMHDAAARFPLICRYPERFAAGARVERLANLVDILPTCLAATGAQLTSHQLDGVDLADLAKDRAQREYVFSQYDQNDMAVFMAASARWKYIYSVADRREFLFDRLLDPEETRNVAANGLRDEPTAMMRRALHEHIRRAGAADVYLQGERWKTFETQTIHPAWRWWSLHPPRDAAWNPDSSFAILPGGKLGLPEGYAAP